MMMNEITKKFIKYSLIGFVSGIGVGILFTAHNIFFNPEYQFGTWDIVYYLFSGLLGVAGMGGSVIYQFESWSILKCTLTHFLLTMITFYLFGSWVGFIKFGEISFWISTACEATAYFIIWLVQYLRGRKDVRKMNEELEQFKTHCRDIDKKEEDGE